MWDLRLVGAALFIFSLTACSGKDKKQDGQATTKEQTTAEKLLGKWKVIRASGEVGGVLEFDIDGKVSMRESENAGKVRNMTYKIDGDKIPMSYKEGGKEFSETMTIKTLNETTLILVDNRGDEAEFNRMK